MQIENKTVVVTGAGSGIGQALTLLLLERGSSVFGVDLDQSALDATQHLAQRWGDQLVLHQADITDSAAVESMPAAVSASLGAPDILINNAGVGQPVMTVLDLDDATARRVMEINFFGTLNMTRAFLPHLLERPSAAIANVASMVAFIAPPTNSVYSASKAAVRMMTESLSAELKGTNVSVSVVVPGVIKTNIAENSGIDVSPSDLGIREMPANDAAEVIISGIEKEKFRILVGRDAMGGEVLARVSPRLSSLLARRQLESLLSD